MFPACPVTLMSRREPLAAEPHRHLRAVASLCDKLQYSLENAGTRRHVNDQHDAEGAVTRMRPGRSTIARKALRYRAGTCKRPYLRFLAAAAPELTGIVHISGVYFLVVHEAITMNTTYTSFIEMLSEMRLCSDSELQRVTCTYHSVDCFASFSFDHFREEVKMAAVRPNDESS